MLQFHTEPDLELITATSAVDRVKSERSVFAHSFFGADGTGSGQLKERDGVGDGIAEGGVFPLSPGVVSDGTSRGACGSGLTRCRRLLQMFFLEGDLPLSLHVAHCYDPPVNLSIQGKTWMRLLSRPAWTNHLSILACFDSPEAR